MAPQLFHIFDGTNNIFADSSLALNISYIPWGERDREVKGIESGRESKILVISPKPRNKPQTKVDYTKLSLEIMLQNYQLVYYVAQKWVNYRDTGVSKKV